MLAKLDAWTTSTERQPYNRLNTSGNINKDKGHFEHSTETKIFFSDLNFLPLLSFLDLWLHLFQTKIVVVVVAAAAAVTVVELNT